MRCLTILGFLIGAFVLFAGSLDAEKLKLKEKVAEAGRQLAGEIHGQAQIASGGKLLDETFKEKLKRFREKVKGFLEKFRQIRDRFPDKVPPNNRPPGAPLDPASPIPATGERLVDEWYADLPWHQKLSTKDSNLIDVPFVMPFKALPKGPAPIINVPSECTQMNLDEARCMLRFGVVNVMAMHRTDALYKSGEAPPGQACEDGQCVEVKLDVMRFHTATKNTDGHEADMFTDNPDKFIDGKDTKGEDVVVNVPSLGFAITEATMFTPWLPWYTGHYCAYTIDGVHDAVCYEDYFTTMIQASADDPQKWLITNPDLFDPLGQPATPFARFCAKNIFSCSLQLGKVNWLTNGIDYETDPKVIGTFHGCGPLGPNEPTRTIPDCQTEVEERTKNLVDQFNAAINNPDYFFDDKHHYPWEQPVHHSREDLQQAIQTNPFIGAYNLTWLTADEQGDPHKGTYHSFFTGQPYVLPKQCTSANYMGARHGSMNDIKKLKDCALDFEIHTSGFFEQWRPLFNGSLGLGEKKQIFLALPGLNANQYGRTTFLFAGVPEQHLGVSFKHPVSGPIHDKMYGASLYTQYLPLVNPADLSLLTKSYTDQYWHNILMSNHMNQTPDHFIRGIRGRTLWHNEYRSQLGFNAGEGIVRSPDDKPVNNAVTNALKKVDFPAGFQVLNHKAPFHGNTCDSCHVRNGSGIPLRPNRQLPQIHFDRGMNLGFNINSDYTYANKTPKTPGNKPSISEVPAMKIVLFDLGGKAEAEHLVQCDVNNHTTPQGAFPTLEPQYYTNKIMNFYGNTLHVNQEMLDPNINFLTLPRYDLTYHEFQNGDGSGYEIVDTTSRNSYKTWYVGIANANFGSCDDTKAFNPKPNDTVNWPTSCNEVNGVAIVDSINNRPPPPSATTTVVGHMHLLGRRLGNTPLLEMIPDQTIKQIQSDQKETFTVNGCYGLTAGTRNGGQDSDGKYIVHYRTCENGVEGEDSKDCYISRFGWIGDRASLEDQIANAAIIEMNITSKESYEIINPDPKNVGELVRYKDRLCGPADKICTGENGANLNTPNSDITEQEIRDMATYQHWLGIANRSEYQVSSQIVEDGEAVFRDLKCHSCHVIDKIVFVKDDNMLPDEERTRLESLKNGQSDYPFISYLGTDLLLHDMGYLSQVAKSPDGMQIRNADGTVKEMFKAWVQPIRTPALKGLRFNRFVTDSIHNAQGKNFLKDSPPSAVTPACDFLMHDGRACDTIEAAYLHDGPAIKNLDMIKKLNELTVDKLKALRAFLYSL